MRSLGVLAFVALVAGCAAPAAVPQQTAIDLQPVDEDAVTGITGRVLSEELAPLAGAVIQVDELLPATTGVGGEFTIALEAGEHKVSVYAIGFMSVARTVAVAEGVLTEVQFLLEVLPVKEPYIELLLMDGYDICTYATPTNVGTAPNPCPLGTPKNQFPIDLPESWQYMVIELTWQTSNSFWVSVQDRGAGCLNTRPCYGVEIGDSPVRIEGAPENEALAKRWSLDGKKMYPSGALKITIANLYAGELREELNSTFYSQCGIVYGAAGIAPRLGCPLGVGYSTGIRFKEHISIFHWEPPAKPSEYSGLPDG